MHQILLIISAITPVLAITQFYLLLFTVSVTCQNLLLLSLQYSYQLGFPVSYPYQAFLFPQSFCQQLLLQVTSFIYLHEVTVSCTSFKSLVTFWYQLLLLLTEICFPNKILFSGISISYSSVTTNFYATNRHSISYSYQVLLSPYYTVATQTTPYSDTPFSYSYQLLLSATLAIYY